MSPVLLVQPGKGLDIPPRWRIHFQARPKPATLCTQVVGCKLKKDLDQRNVEMSRNIFKDRSIIKILKTQLIVISVLTASFFAIAFSDRGNDTNTAIFGTVLAFGVILGLSIYNGMVIRFFEIWNTKIRVINYCLPVIPFIILLGSSLNSNTEFTKSKENIEFAIMLCLFLGSNLLGYYLINPEQDGAASRQR